MRKPRTCSAGPDGAGAGAGFGPGCVLSAGRLGVAGSSCRRMLPAFGTCCATATAPKQSVDAAKAANWASLFGIGVHRLYPHIRSIDLLDRLCQRDHAIPGSRPEARTGPGTLEP